MVFVRPESPLRETKSQAADAWFRAPSAVTRKRPASPLPCPRSTGTPLSAPALSTIRRNVDP